MARPIKVVGDLQFAQTDHFSVITEIVKSVAQLTMSGGKFGPLLHDNSETRPELTFAGK